MDRMTPQTDRTATRLARSASALMLVSAAISAYWAAGGMGLLGTVGGSIARWGRDGGVGVRLALAAIVVLKLVAAWLPVGAVRERCPRAVRRLAWLEAAILTAYGGVLTATGLAVQAGLVGGATNADWKALDWHAYLWDPWFLIVGLLIWVALRRTRSVGTGAPGPMGPWRPKASGPTSAGDASSQHMVAGCESDRLDAGAPVAVIVGQANRKSSSRRPVRRRMSASRTGSADSTSTAPGKGR